MASKRIDQRERSILEIAAGSWEDERRNVFAACYRVMRKVDDIVDNRRAEKTPISVSERRQLLRKISDVMSGDRDENGRRRFKELCRRFVMPSWPWRRWNRAMRYDLATGFFPTYDGFLRYAEGAAIAPGAIFMHLCGLTRHGGRFSPPRFNIHHAAQPLALFCYHVHILRDLNEDAAAGIIFIPDDILGEHGLSRDQFLAALASNDTPALRGIIAFYHRRASVYLHEVVPALANVLPLMEERYQRSIRILYALYRAVYEKIDPSRNRYTGNALALSPREKKRIASAPHLHF
ncbi:MAG: squalene/phytoene synthase family protein [Spirochaetes bacterium]|nr:squalene/phytoene synthase family protein [Spirochaetota bacterium]